MEDLISNAHTIFDDHPTQYSPPLPPTPAGELAASYSYGSKTTKVTTVLSPIVPSTSSPDADISPSQLTQDFTPQLPRRPTSSIHPSSRIYPDKTKDNSSLQLRLDKERSNSEQEHPPDAPLATNDVDNIKSELLVDSTDSLSDDLYGNYP